MTFLLASALALGTSVREGVASDTQSPSSDGGGTYYVSTTGSDTNPGTASAPFQSFNKAISMLAAGDELQIYGGTYTQQLSVTKSGTSSAPIRIKAVPGQTVIIDGEGTRDELVLVPDGASSVNISDLTCRNASVVCVLLRGTYINVSNFEVSGAEKFGIRVTGSYVTVENSSIHDNVLENVNGTNTTGGWGSALRSAQATGDNNVFRFNDVFHNWGEGIIAGSSSSQVYGNTVHDNFSKNIYVGNTHDVDVYQNVTYSTDPEWFRSGNPADCISLSEELINPTYGAQLGNIRVFNNITSNCKTGIGYSYAEVSDNGCDNCLFAFNTITSSENACIKVISGPKNHIEIADNICSAGIINVPSGDISVHDNLMGDAHLTGGPMNDPDSYRLLPDSPAIGAGVDVGISSDFYGVLRPPFDIGAIQFEAASPTPTSTSTPTATASATATSTPTATATASATATSTSTPTASPTSSPSATSAVTPAREDVNRDGRLDVLDVQLCVNVFLGTQTDPVIVARADVNGDSTVNVLDVQTIVNAFLNG
jgi:hypothetical protein